MAAAGVNPYLMEISNLREHCSWVHSDAKDDATQKAHKIRNLLQAMRRDGLIHRTGPKATAIWRLGAGQPDAQS